ncbi:MAG: MFS transporter [Betaproteobacteria bacterium]|nr:MFS transporter [Betaproteobacteria bacterium]MDH5220658.1 MFS transporter [Betaproteobacteria bacterium]MDH5351339.1 MFS transporter [Betaproteobacteria bacterium]
MHDTVRTQIPERLDRLPWCRFHWLVVLALGVTWILDGLEVTFKGAVSGVLQLPETMGFSPVEIGLLGSGYLAGAVAGALVFGRLTDRYGRKRLFFVTLAVYLAGVGLSAFSWDFWSFLAFRFVTGCGIGGEYAAINSAIDELIPARHRGRVGLMINGSFWLGAALGSGATVLLLDPARFAPDLGWRLGFGIGAALGLTVLFFRRFLPESPRWLLTHGRAEEAERIVAGIERGLGRVLPPPTGPAIAFRPRSGFGLAHVAHVMLARYRSRSALCVMLMMSQAFLYNAIFFTYALVLTRFYGVPAGETGLYLLPFAIGNFLGPVVLGHWFDTVGRRPMIALTYGTSAALLAITGWLFHEGLLTAGGQTALWSVIFFFASAAASSAYLTASEVFPLEIRALAIAIFFAVGTGTGGVLAPWLFGALIGTGSRGALFAGYLVGAGLMLLAVGAVLAYGVRAERKPLEEVAPPLTSAH